MVPCPGKTHAEDLREYGRRKESVHDGTAERGFGCEFRIEVDRVFVARDFGESDHAFLRKSNKIKHLTNDLQ